MWGLEAGHREVPVHCKETLKRQSIWFCFNYSSQTVLRGAPIGASEGRGGVVLPLLVLQRLLLLLLLLLILLLLMLLLLLVVLLLLI